MRLSTFGKPRVIGCAEDLLHHIALPRGLLKEVLDLFQSHSIAVDVTDHRFSGVPIERIAVQAAIAFEEARGRKGFECGNPFVFFFFPAVLLEGLSRGSFQRDSFFKGRRGGSAVGDSRYP